MAFIIFYCSRTSHMFQLASGIKGLLPSYKHKLQMTFFFPAFLSCCRLLHHYWRHLLITGRKGFYLNGLFPFIDQVVASLTM